MKIKELENCYKITEKISNNENNIQLLCCRNKELNRVNLDKEKYRINIKKYKIPNKTILNCIEMKENNIIILGNGGASYYIDLFNNNGQLAEYEISDKTFIGGIKINDKIVVLYSNSIIQNGEDKLIFYNIKTKRISDIIEGYSFTVWSDNLLLISTEEIKNNNKILLCACKRYNKDKKNGILLINPNLGDNKRMENEFYETYNFEVYCFCQIFNFENKNKNLEIDIEKYKKGIKKTITNYFFVGGFDLEKREGKIKLFKIIYGEKIWNSKIKYIQDIEIEDNENFEEFNGPISCIIQSRSTGNILVTCYNGNVYLFTPPNIDYYLKNNN